MNRSETQVHLISDDNPETYRGALRGPVIGLDCEWVGQNKVALLQLADAFGTCLLVRLNVLGKTPDFADKILTNPKVHCHLSLLIKDKKSTVL